MPKSVPFSKKLLDSLPIPGAGKRVDYHDTVQNCLTLRITSTGCKSFYVRRKTKGDGHDRYFLGRYPDLPVEEARKLAALILAQIAMGENPREEKTEDRDLTVGEVVWNYIEGHGKTRCIRWEDMQKDYERYVADWHNRPYSSISKSDTQSRMNQIITQNGPAAANHMLILMRAAYNWNLNSGLLTGENPWAHVKPFKIQSRERFLKPQEFARLYQKLSEMRNHTIRDFILMLLYTGARKSNVLAMSWEHVDLDLRIWKIPRTKNGDWQIVPLTDPAVSLLQSRLVGAESKWVFPGKDKSNHLVEPKRAWYELLEAAEITDLRIHDLRRTLGSYMAMSNHSLKIIGTALGHKSTAATEIYSRLAHEPVRAAMQQAQTELFKALQHEENQAENGLVS